MVGEQVSWVRLGSRNPLEKVPDWVGGMPDGGQEGMLPVSGEAGLTCAVASCRRKAPRAFDAYAPAREAG